MAISITKLISEKNIDPQSSYATASITPAANKVILAMYTAHASSIPATPTISGCGLTWTQANTVGVATGNDDLRVTLWRGVSSAPTSGAITFGSTGSPAAAGWIVAELTNADIINPIVQSTTNSNSSSSALTCTLAAFSSTSNATLGVFGVIDQDQTATQTAGSGFTEIGAVAWARRVQAIMEFRADNDTSVDAGTTNSSGDGHAGIAVEIRAATLQNVKTILGVDIYSVKTINGLAIASVKSFNGLS